MAAATTSPRTPPTPQPPWRQCHTRTPRTPRTLSTFHLGGLRLCLLARRTVGRFLSLRPGFPLWTSTAPHHTARKLGRLIAGAPCARVFSAGRLGTVPNVARASQRRGVRPAVAGCQITPKMAENGLVRRLVLLSTFCTRVRGPKKLASAIA